MQPVKVYVHRTEKGAFRAVIQLPPETGINGHHGVVSATSRTKQRAIQSLFKKLGATGLEVKS